MSNLRVGRRMGRGVVGCLVGVAGLAASAQAQPAVWNVGNGSWNTAGNWLPANVPDTATETAVLGGLAAYAVDLNLSPNILAIEITNPSAVLSLNSTRNLTIQAASINNGTININPSGSSNNAFLTITNNPVTLTGTGQIRMLAGSDDAQIISLGGGVLTNGAGHTIRGVGQIGAALNNLGTVAADVSISTGGATLVLTTGAKSNSGVFSAAAGSTLAVNTVAVTQTGLGQIRPDGGSVTFASSSLTGGRIAGPSSFASVSGTNTFTGVTLDASGSVNAATVLAIAGGLTNNGVLGINPQSSSSNAFVRFDETGALGGSGEIHMLAGSDDSQVLTATGVTVTQGANHAIRGAGVIISTLVNNGEVWADESVTVGTTPLLVVATNPVTNNNVMGAAADSNLQLQSVAVDQTGGGELRAEGGQLTFVGAALTGGSIESTGSGLYVVSSGTNTFTGVTANAPGQVNPSAVLAVAGTGLTNNGVLRINPQSSSSNALLRFEVTGTLGGSGQVQLNAGSDDSQVLTAAGATLTQAPSHTIRGAGQISALMTNQGTIIADPTVVVGSTTLTLLANNKGNSGVMQADTGGTLTVSGITIDQAGGGVLRVNGGTLTFTSAGVLGGQITTTGSGSWAATNGTNVFNSVTSGAPGQVNATASLVVTGSGLTNNADLTINPQSSSSNAFLTFGESGTLGGSGRVILFAGSDDSQITVSGGVSVTHGASHSIVGSGIINMSAGASMANQGLISPGAAGGGGGVGAISLSGVMTHSGVLEVEIAGTGTSNYDRLTGNGQYTLGGTLDLSLIGGYVPARQHNGRVIAGTSVSGRFNTVIKPTLPAGVELRVVYLSNAVEVWFHCPPDFTTGAIPGSVGYGVPNGTLNNDDFFFYLSMFAAANPDADLTTGAIPGSPGYGVPNGVINNDDFFYYLSLFAQGCT